MSTKNKKVTFIIPAKNEESMLPGTLDSIRSVIGYRLVHEIIVIDNGSSDNTVAIAKSKGAHVVIQSAGTIGSLRNTGAKLANSEILVFLDADVSITDSWIKPFLDVIQSLHEDPYMITGSRCSAEESAGWIASSWFRQPPSIRQTTHVGTGHMITSKILFDELAGFDEKLQTGEDFDFCARAEKSGAKVLENHNLKVIHYGVPRSLIGFFRREVWHGSGDVTSLKTTLKSKVAIVASVFLIAHIGMIIGIIYYPATLALLLICLLSIVSICVLSAWKKYSYAPVKVIFKNTLLYYVYYWGRGVSVINRIVPILSHRSPRSGRVRS